MQDQLIQAQIVGVFRKTVNTKNGQKTIYQVQVQDGTIYSTFLAELGQEAEGLLFHNVTMSVRIQQNEQYINRYLQKIIASAPADSGFTAPPQPAQTILPAPTQNGPAPVQQTQTVPTPPPVTSHSNGLTEGATQVMSVQQANQFEDKKRTEIHRQVACKVAASLSQPGDSQMDFWGNVEILMRYFDGGVLPLAVSIELAEQAAA